LKLVAHPRKLLRHATVNILKAANICGGRGYPNRPLPGWKEELPYFCVYTTEETGQNDTHPPNYERKPELNIEIVSSAFQLNKQGEIVKINMTLDDDMDDVAEAVEDAILAVERPYLEDPLTGIETVDDLTYVGTSQKLVADGDVITGSTIIKFAPVYHSRFEPKETPEDFETADVKINPVPPGIHAVEDLRYEGISL
jgi:hypothetical protein